MTPKEKATQLIDAMSFSVHSVINYQTGKMNPAFHATNPYAIQCALIAVDEVIGHIEATALGDVIDARVKYWNEVKQEIENL